MKRLALLLFLSLPLFAQTDLAVSIENQLRQPTLDTWYVVRASWKADIPPENVSLEVDFPGDVFAIYEWDSGTHCTNGHPVRCTLGSFKEHDGGFTARVAFPTAGTYVATARVTSTTPDPRPENNTATHTIVIAGLPSLRAFGTADLDDVDVVDPAGTGRLRFGLQNDGQTATNLVLRAQLPEGGTFTDVTQWQGVSCMASGNNVTCHLAQLPPLGYAQLSATFLAPDVSDGRAIPFVVTVDADEEDYEPADDVSRGNIRLRRRFAVTSPADEGLGTLRQAILDSRVFCSDTPCLIDMHADEALTIQPRTPLPNLLGRVKLDGGMAKTTLDGSLLGESDALHYEGGCELRVDRMVIRNFKGHAIEAHVEPRKSCILLTPLYVTNSELANNVRGIVTKGISATIEDNTILGNARAGIFADGVYYTEIEGNAITGNGASGIFINASGQGGYLPSGAEIYDNVIRGNGEWGIARTPAGSVHMYRNSISDNNLYGIDTGLDLDSPGMALKPVLFSAVYRPDLNATIVRGHAEAGNKGGPSGVEVYASSSLSEWGYPEAETLVLQHWVNEGDFELTVPGDLRGKWITATGSQLTAILFDRPRETRADGQQFRYQTANTSELSNAVKVE